MHSLALCLPLFASSAAPTAAQEVSIPYTKHVLENGLEVILHEDHSDPVVGVYVYYHVGSGREQPGKSGFAHLFEHMMFQGSQNVGDDQHFKLIQEAGGTLNGTTNTDRTNYFETLPSNQLELALWLEADRMGFLLPAMTQEKLDNQREVVKNERRQNYENRPYGLTSEVLARSLYPPEHPYSWTTIGSMDDLSAASLEDVADFFRRYYGPNNATLAIGGDIDPEVALAMVEKYFGAIPRGPEVADPEPRPVTLAHTKRVVIEDKVQVPELTLTWPTVEIGHADEAALDLLARLLAGSKSSILDQALTIDERLASQVSAFHGSRELAGTLSISLRPHPGISLTQLENRVRELIRRMAEEGVDGEALKRQQTRFEAFSIRRLETVGSRTSRLASDNTFFDDPGHVTKALQALLAVQPADVERALETYVSGKHSVVLSCVPEGQIDTAASGRTPAQLAEETQLDRTQKPAPAPEPGLRLPSVWHAELANGVAVIGTPYDELPLCSFTISVPAGHLRESMETLGLSSMVADLLDEGAGERDATELEDEIDGLGASLFVRSGDEEISITASMLERNAEAVVAIVADILLEPRFDEADLERLRAERLTQLESRADSIRAIAGDAWNAITYGSETLSGAPASGTPQTIAQLDVASVRSFWESFGTPVGARLSYVGPRDAEGVQQLFSDLAARWNARENGAEIVEASFSEPAPRFVEQTTIFLVDKAGAAQSEIRIGHPSVATPDPSWWPLQILNYGLGGSFSSRINMNLREDKGYTYGARSSFRGGKYPSPFVASAAVRTDVTAASVAEFLKELEGILQGPTEEEIAFTKSAMRQATARQFESTRGLMGYLDPIVEYGLPDDYLAGRMQQVDQANQQQLTELAKQSIDPSRLAILVVGDAALVREPLKELGVGSLVELDQQGRPIE